MKDCHFWRLHDAPSGLDEVASEPHQGPGDECGVTGITEFGLVAVRHLPRVRSWVDGGAEGSTPSSLSSKIPASTGSGCWQNPCAPLHQSPKMKLTLKRKNQLILKFGGCGFFFFLFFILLMFASFSSSLCPHLDLAP